MFGFGKKKAAPAADEGDDMEGMEEEYAPRPAKRAETPLLRTKSVVKGSKAAESEESAQERNSRLFAEFVSRVQNRAGSTVPVEGLAAWQSQVLMILWDIDSQLEELNKRIRQLGEQ